MTKATFSKMPGQFDPRGAFNQSFFGAIQHGDKYHDVDLKTMDVHDMRPALNNAAYQAQLKYSGVSSATAGGAGTAGVAMIPVYVSPEVTDRSRKLTPFVEMTSRVANMGVTHDFNFISSKSAAVFGGEMPALADQDYTPDRSSVAMKYMYSKGSVSGQRQAAQPPYMVSGQATTTGAGLGGSPFGSVSAPNALQAEVLVRTRALKELEEDSFWNGDTDDSSLEFNGIIDQQADTNDTDKNTTAIDYDDLEGAAKDAYDDSGFPNIAGASSAVVKDVRKIIFDAYRYTPADMTTNLPFGITSRLTIETLYGSVPLLPSQYISNTSGSKALYLLDMTEIYFAVLQDATYEELAKTTDGRSFLIKQYEALIMRAPQFNACVTEIA